MNSRNLKSLVFQASEDLFLVYSVRHARIAVQSHQQKIADQFGRIGQISQQEEPDIFLGDL